MTLVTGHTAQQAGNALPDYFANELPGAGLPTSQEINHQLFGAPELPVRAWVSGTIALEPHDIPGQGQSFANWGQSALTTHHGVSAPVGFEPTVRVQADKPRATQTATETMLAPTPTFRRPLARALGWLAARIDSI